MYATGLRAQVQHLKAYCSRDNLNEECVDERFGYVKRYSAPFVEWLGQKENPAGLGWPQEQDTVQRSLELLTLCKGESTADI